MKAKKIQGALIEELIRNRGNTLAIKIVILKIEE